MDFYLIEVGALNKTSEPSLNSDTSSNCDFLDSSSYNNSMNSGYTPVGGASLIPEGYGKLLGSYLAGLIEGDGSIIVPKTIRNQKGKLLYPIVKITFVEKDKPLALKIKEVIGGGTIVEYNNSSYIELLFQDVKSIQKIAVLLNGKMRTPKIEALYRLIDWLNNKSKTGIVLPKLGLDKSSLGSNPWLAGFIDSDGNFYCGFNFTSEGIAKIVKCYMRISQKILYKLNSELPEDQNSNKKIMEKIQNFLNIKNITEIKRTKEKYLELAYEIRTLKQESCVILIDYLTVYPLFSSKFQDYLDWKKAHEIRISTSYKTIEGTSQLISIKNSMNTKRTQFNWDSLNRFYCSM